MNAVGTDGAGSTGGNVIRLLEFVAGRWRDLLESVAI